MELTIKYEVLLNGQRQRDFQQKLEISPDEMADGFERVAVINWEKADPPLKYEKGITARWVGEAMHVPLRVPATMAAKAIQEGKPLEATVRLPLAVTFREGKEFFRNAEGQAEGVIDATFADVGCDYAQLDLVA